MWTIIRSIESTCELPKGLKCTVITYLSVAIVSFNDEVGVISCNQMVLKNKKDNDIAILGTTIMHAETSYFSETIKDYKHGKNRYLRRFNLKYKNNKILDNYMWHLLSK